MRLIDFEKTVQQIHDLLYGEGIEKASITYIRTEDYKKMISVFSKLDGCGHLVEMMEQYYEWYAGRADISLSQFHLRYLYFFGILNQISLSMQEKGLPEMTIPKNILSSLYSIPSYGALIRGMWGRESDKLVGRSHLMHLIQDLQQRIDPFDCYSFEHYPLKTS